MMGRYFDFLPNIVIMLLVYGIYRVIRKIYFGKENKAAM